MENTKAHGSDAIRDDDVEMDRLIPYDPDELREMLRKHHEIVNNFTIRGQGMSGNIDDGFVYNDE